MRDCNYGVNKSFFYSMKDDIKIEIFRNMARSKYFEDEVIKAHQNKKISYPIYLSSGQESIYASLSLIIKDFLIFTQHRCHATYLSIGGNPEKLRDELLGLQSGTSNGKAGSNCIQCHEPGIHMFGHHGLIGENVPIAVGAALGSGKNTVCIFGDGAAEEDYVFSSMGFAATHKLPVLFICDDNNLSILTPIKDRRSWSLVDIAKALSLPSLDISDDPWTIFETAKEFCANLPALINIKTCRKNWHVGSGNDGPPEWDRYKIVKGQLIEIGLAKKVDEIENKEKQFMGSLWSEKRLRILLEKQHSGI